MPLETALAGMWGLSNSNNLKYGTVELGNILGTVISSTLKREADIEEIVGMDSQLIAILLKNPRFVLTMKTQFMSDVVGPGLTDTIEFPLVELTGHILDIQIDWEQAGLRQLTIVANHWDTLASATSLIHNPTTDAWAAHTQIAAGDDGES